MNAKELNHKLKEITELKNISFKHRYAVTEIGECHTHFVALYGKYENCGINWNNSIFYMEETSLNKVITNLRKEGLNTIVWSPPKGEFEVLVEVNTYYKGDSDYKYYEFVKSNFVTENSLTFYHAKQPDKLKLVSTWDYVSTI